MIALTGDEDPDASEPGRGPAIAFDMRGGCRIAYESEADASPTAEIEIHSAPLLSGTDEMRRGSIRDHAPSAWRSSCSDREAPPGHADRTAAIDGIM
jgi:hypothetical protein